MSGNNVSSSPNFLFVSLEETTYSEGDEVVSRVHFSLKDFPGVVRKAYTMYTGMAIMEDKARNQPKAIPHQGYS